jgi:hypothetical protein
MDKEVKVEFTFRNDYEAYLATCVLAKLITVIEAARSKGVSE